MLGRLQVAAAPFMSLRKHITQDAGTMDVTISRGQRVD